MLEVRQAEARDVGTIRQMIQELAEFEHEPASAMATESDLLRDGFGPSPYFESLIADWDGSPVGFALYFFNYSTWQGRPGLYLEDLFVRPTHRGRGIGSALFRRLAEVALARNCGRLVWQVLDWNVEAIGFYCGLGATPQKEWLTMRLEGNALYKLAKS